MKLRLRELADRMASVSGLDEAVACLKAAGEVMGLPLAALVEDVSGNTPARDSEGRRIADLCGWPVWMTDRWYGHGYVRQHPIYLRCRFEAMPFGEDLVGMWARLGALTAAQQQMKRDTDAFGLKVSITVPVHLPLGQTAAVHWSGREPLDLDAILAACGGQLLTIGHLFMAAAQARAQPNLGAGDLAHLTDRQVDCLHWLARGKTISETAIILDISAHTVREHLRAVAARLHAGNTPHAIALASQFGILGRLR